MGPRLCERENTPRMHRQKAIAAVETCDIPDTVALFSYAAEWPPGHEQFRDAFCDFYASLCNCYSC